MNFVRYVSAILLVAIAGCGGGGASDELSIGSVTPSAVTATFSNKTAYEGGDPREVVLTASFSGNATGEIFVVVEDPDAVFAVRDLEINGETSATLRLDVKDSAAVGLYEKPMVVHVCRDAACANEFAGSPRTVQKHITIQGTTVSTSALSFASTVGMGAPSQTVAVTTPSGTDFNYEFDAYVEHTAPDGTTNLQYLDEVFSITKTSSGLVVHPVGKWAGHYAVKFNITTPGYSNVAVNLAYQVDEAATPVATPLTSSVSASGQAGSTDDIPIYVEYVHVMDRDPDAFGSISVNATAGSPDPGSTLWLRYYDQTTFTHGAGPADNADRLRFFLNPCFFGQDCLAPGTYTADIELTVSAFGEESTFTVPVTFTVNP